MNADQIQEKFKSLLQKGSAGIAMRKRIGMSARQATTYRYYLETGQPISLELQIKWIQLAGVQAHDPASYTKQDLVEVAKAAISAGAAAKEMGPEYVVEKYLNSKTHGKKSN